MSTSSDSSGGASTPPTRSTVLLLLADMADTTWRMFGPVILFTGFGMWADDRFKTGPWCSLAGVLIGSSIAGLLIKKQLARVNKRQ